MKELIVHWQWLRLGFEVWCVLPDDPEGSAVPVGIEGPLFKAFGYRAPTVKEVLLQATQWHAVAGVRYRRSHWRAASCLWVCDQPGYPAITETVDGTFRYSVTSGDVATKSLLNAVTHWQALQSQNGGPDAV